MSELKIGDRIKDNDPRMNGRTLVITTLDARYVFGRRSPNGPEYRILRHRVFTDGKERRTGFSRPPQQEGSNDR